MSSHKSKIMVMESENVTFYQRLVRVYQSKINKIEFASSEVINKAIKTRLLQFLVNQNFINTRKNILKNSEFIVLSDQQLSDTINDRYLYPKNSWHDSKIGTFKNVLINYIYFWVFWFLMLLALCKFWGRRRISSTSNGSILYGILESFNSSEKDYVRIHNYLNSTTKDGLSTSNFFILKSNKFLHRLSENIYGAKFPEATFVYFTALSFSSRLKAIWFHIYSLMENHLLWIKHPILACIASEFATLRIMEIVERNDLLKSTVFSTSNNFAHHLTSQLCISSKLHHVYYNIVPSNPVPKSDMYPSLGTLDPFLMIPISGTHWVWSDEDVQFMKKRYHQQDVKKGGVPSLFYSKEVLPSRKIKPSYDIIIFDVAPINFEIFNPYGVVYYYGRYENAIALIEHVIEASNKAYKTYFLNPPNIALKPKRNMLAHHDPRYRSYIEKLAEEHSNFSILDADQNIFELFHADTIIINRPFTSTAHLGALSGSKSIFYDPHHEIAETNIKLDNLYYSSGRDSLTELLCNILKNK